MPFSKYSQYPVVGRISANGIKNLFKHEVVSKKVVILQRFINPGVLGNPL